MGISIEIFVCSDCDDKLEMKQWAEYYDGYDPRSEKCDLCGKLFYDDIKEEGNPIHLLDLDIKNLFIHLLRKSLKLKE